MATYYVVPTAANDRGKCNSEEQETSKYLGWLVKQIFIHSIQEGSTN